MYLWLACLALGGTSLDEGANALAAFRVEEAVTLLHMARGEGPYAHAELVRLYESLGVAHAYLGDEAMALEAFDTLLALSPGHAISYTLSPKVTFLFERARARAIELGPPVLQISWPYDLEVVDPIPITLEVAADPKQFMRRAVVVTRRKGETEFRTHEAALEPAGQHTTVVLPPLAPAQQAPQTLQFYVAAYDPAGNEVHMVGDVDHPREINLSYREVVPWYRRWWVWAVAGGVLAGVTGAAVYIGGREPPDTIDGSFQVHR